MAQEHLIAPTKAVNKVTEAQKQRWWESDRGQRNITWFLMTLPALIWIIIFKYLTMAGIVLAFQDYKPRLGILDSEWVGLENFEFLFATDAAWRATVNTLLMNSLFIVMTTIVSLFIATLMYQVYSSYFVRFYQTMLLLPRFISWVIVSYFVFALLKADGGIVNKIFESFGADPVRWYSTPGPWRIILVLAYLWNNIGIASLIYLSGMLAINPQLFEAASIDGANWFTQFRRIIFPSILPLIIINVLIAIGGIFHADFGLFFQVPRDQGLLYATTDVLDTFIYRSLIITNNISMSAAANFYQAIVGFGVVITANWVIRRIEREDEPLAMF